ncbi:hypothetical protein DF186_16040, partial [Enterococcus hirae]
DADGRALGRVEVDHELAALGVDLAVLVPRRPRPVGAGHADLDLVVDRTGQGHAGFVDPVLEGGPPVVALLVDGLEHVPQVLRLTRVEVVL